MATLKTIRTWVSALLDQDLVSGDIPTSGVYWTRDQVNLWINEAYKNIYAQLVDIEAPWLEIEGTGTYTAGARFMSIQTMLSITYDPLKLTGVYDITGNTSSYGAIIPFTPYQQFSQRQNGLNNVGTSGVLYGQRCCSWAGHEPMQLFLNPRPQTNLSLRVRWVPALPSTKNAAVVTRNVEAMSNDNDIPCSIPVAFHEVLSTYAAIQAKLKEESDFRPLQMRYDLLLAQLLKSADERQQENSRTVFVTDGSDYEGTGGFWDYR